LKRRGVILSEAKDPKLNHVDPSGTRCARPSDGMMVMLKTTEAKAKGLDDKVSTAISTANEGRNGGRNGGRNSIVIPPKGTDARDEQVLALIRENIFITQKEISKALSIGENTVLRAIKSLKEKGILRRAGSTKKGFWVILEDDK